MQKLMQSRLFQLLLDSSLNEESLSQLEESCDEFALKILAKLRLETSYQELYFGFGFIHVKLAGICERLFGEQKKKCP